MDTELVWRAIDDERGRLADLLDDLSDAEWDAPSLCSAWSVREVAAHLTLAHTGLLSATVSLVRAGGGFDRMIRDTAVRHARLPVEQFAPRLRAMVGSRRTAPFVTPREPMVDVLCHGQDIARALGRTHPMPVDAAAAATDHVWNRSFPFRAQRRLHGVELVATDVGWRAGDGVRVEGPISALLLLVTGRPAALADLSGPGVAALGATFPPGAGPAGTVDASGRPSGGERS
ncbi:maleylpyruvate isomerase family mycothiol-dependent enzyme [Pseudonocardia tropica]|uniref:Maleylpyruvate isomerase family mycothiol-dependent enzyme n=1 Tax=Pseudonocardia tropica TaxID=681289 RepID=A0ABV1K308_9PSEU